MIAGLGLISVAALAAVTQQNVQRLPWSGSELNLDDLGTKVEDFVPYAFFNLLPLLGMLIVILMGLVLAKPQKGVRPNLNPGFAFALFGYGMVFVGMLGTVLYAVDDLALQGTVFEEATLIYIVYGAVLGVMGGVVYWAPKLWGNAPSAAKVAPIALLGVLATVLASFPHYIAGFLDQPAGPLYDNDDFVIWNVLVLVGHLLMGLTVLAFIGLVCPPIGHATANTTRSATIRGTARRSSGPPRPRLPATTSSMCRSCTRPSRCSTSRPPAIPPRHERREQQLMYALPPAPSTLLAARRSSARRSPPSGSSCSWVGCSPLAVQALRAPRCR